MRRGHRRMGCSEESEFRVQQARRRDRSLQTQRAALAGQDRVPPHPLRSASIPRRIRFSGDSRRKLSGVSSGSRQALIRLWECRCGDTAALFFSPENWRTILLYVVTALESRRAVRKNKRTWLSGPSRTVEIDWTCSRQALPYLTMEGLPVIWARIAQRCATYR